MSRCSEALTSARKEEIVSACAQLYQTKCFKDITLQEIGSRTSFTRTSIYNYFQTKEEIFLALFQREYEAWIRDLEALCREHAALSAGAFAGELARTLERRGLLLKLMSMNHYDMEANSRLENLVAFKRAYGRSLQAVARCLKQFFPRMTEGEIQDFIYAFFPFLFGVYPYTTVTDKQAQAMALAHISYPRLSIYEITRALAEKLLRGCGGAD